MASERNKLRLKSKEARKNQALEDLAEKKLFKTDPLRAFCELANLGTKYKLSYKEIIAQGLLLLDVTVRDKVINALENMTITYPYTADTKFNGETYYVVRGKERNNFFQQNRTGNRSEPRWALTRARDYMYSEDHEDDLDEPVFAPGANVLGSMN